MVKQCFSQTARGGDLEQGAKIIATALSSDVSTRLRPSEAGAHGLHGVSRAELGMSKTTSKAHESESIASP